MYQNYTSIIILLEIHQFIIGMKIATYIKILIANPKNDT